MGSSYSYDHVTSDYGPGAGADNDAEVAEMVSALASADTLSNNSSSPLLQEGLDDSNSINGSRLSEHGESLAMEQRSGISRIMTSSSSRAGYSALTSIPSSPMSPLASSATTAGVGTGSSSTSTGSDAQSSGAPILSAEVKRSS